MPYGFSFSGLLWDVLYLAPFVMMIFHKEKLVRLFQIGVGVYVLGFIGYTVVRVMQFPHTPDRWVVLGPRTIAVAYLLKLLEERLVPHEKDRAALDRGTSGWVKAAYLVAAGLGLGCLIASFIWPQF
jgi:hypothetical protein